MKKQRVEIKESGGYSCKRNSKNQGLNTALFIKLQVQCETKNEHAEVSEPGLVISIKRKGELFEILSNCEKQNRDNY